MGEGAVAGVREALPVEPSERADSQTRGPRSGASHSPPIHPERLRRALGLTAEPLGDGRWLVTGGQSPHVVTTEPEPDCDCRDYVTRGVRMCKHVLAVRLAALDADLRAALRDLLRQQVT